MICLSFVGLLLVAVISLPHEVSIQHPPHTRLVSFQLLHRQTNVRPLPRLIYLEQQTCSWQCRAFKSPICTRSTLTAHSRFFFFSEKTKKSRGASWCPAVAVEFRWLLYLALIPVAEPWEPWESEKPPCQFAMCGPQQNPLFSTLHLAAPTPTL